MLDFLAQRSDEKAPALLRSEGEALSYGGLAMAASAVLEALRARVGEVARCLVGIAVEDEAGFLASLLAVLEAGGVALPLDLRRGLPALQAEAARLRALAIIVGDRATDRLEIVAGDATRRALPETAALALRSAAGRRAIHSRAGLLASAEAARVALGLDRSTRLATLAWPGALVDTLLGTLGAGGALVDVGALPPEASSAALERLGGTVAIGSAAALRALAGTKLKRGVVLGPLTNEVAAALAARLAPIELRIQYGSAETLAVADALPDGPLVPRGGATLVVEGGRLEVASPWTMLGYLDDAAATLATLEMHDDRRWVRTGDRAEEDLRFTGYRDGTLELRGERVDPTALEAELRGVAGVGEAAVVVCLGPAVEPRLYAFYAGEGEPPRHPARLLQLDSLPHRADGSIDREALRRMVSTD